MHLAKWLLAAVPLAIALVVGLGRGVRGWLPSTGDDVARIVWQRHPPESALSILDDVEREVEPALPGALRDGFDGAKDCASDPGCKEEVAGWFSGCGQPEKPKVSGE